LEQFLRVRVAAAAMQDLKLSVAELRERLKQGELCEVAGYEMSGRMAEELAAVRLTVRTGVVNSLHWMEIVRRADSQLSGTSLETVRSLRELGVAIEIDLLPGEPFWTAVEIVRNETLVQKTVQKLAEP
jgi:hypothetical protein